MRQHERVQLKMIHHRDIEGTENIPCLTDCKRYGMDPLSTIKDISALVKKYNDLELMKQIVDLQNEVFELQQNNLRLQKELSELQRSTEAESAMISSPPLNYYYRHDDPVPFCPTCWEANRKPIHLPPAEPWNGGVRRDCRVCNQTYWEEPMHSLSRPIKLTRTSQWT